MYGAFERKTWFMKSRKKIVGLLHEHDTDIKNGPVEFQIKT